MSNYSVSGRLHIKGNTQVVSDKFSKRDLVIATDGQFPQYVSLQLTQDKTALLDAANVGDEVTAQFNLNGREWTAPDGTVKYFNTLTVWDLKVTHSAGAIPGVDSGKPAPNYEQVPDNIQDDPLPF